MSMRERQRPCTSNQVRRLIRAAEIYRFINKNIYQKLKLRSNRITCPCSRYMLEYIGNWKGVHPDTFKMNPLNNDDMCGRDNMLIHGGDCAADPSRVRSAQFSSVYLQAFAACALSDKFFRAVSSFPMPYAPASNVTLSWKLYSSNTGLLFIFAACL